MGTLQNKVALITGGTTGIGLATAKLFQKEGAQVAITGRNPETLKAAESELGPKAAVLRADAANLAEIADVTDQIRKRFGRIDILFANAGIAKFSPISDATESLFDDMFDVNVKGLYFTIQKALPLIPDGGAILLNASVAGSKGYPDTSIYSATKAAVRSFGRTLAAELAPRGIRVNTISPGPISTPIFNKVGLPAEAVAGMKENFVSGVALKRIGEPDEVAQAALFLASTAASYISGSELFVDGGMAEL
jgi:NAD(P)-dependent dehydrogenase (short-subunit alcohol dehydrogenase family)